MSDDDRLKPGQSRLYATFHVQLQSGFTLGSAVYILTNQPPGDARLSRATIRRLVSDILSAPEIAALQPVDAWLTNWFWLRPDDGEDGI